MTPSREVAIVGSRTFSDLDYMLEKSLPILRKIGADGVVSGGAKGADALSEKVAEAAGLPHRHIKADWKRLGRAAGPVRNAEVVKACVAMIAFPGGNGGTEGAIGLARKAGKEVHVFLRTESKDYTPCETPENDLPLLKPVFAELSRLFSKDAYLIGKQLERTRTGLDRVTVEEFHGLVNKEPEPLRSAMTHAHRLIGFDGVRDVLSRALRLGRSDQHG